MVTQEELGRIRSAVSIVDLIGETVKLTELGRHHVGPCPFCKKRNHDFTVDSGRGFYHCFSCGAHGDVFRFLMDRDQVTFSEAIRKLRVSLAIETTLDVDAKLLSRLND